jgi:deferrochelatase/peroxidase EfeB
VSRFDRRRFLEVAGSATAGVALGSAGTIAVVDRKISTATIPFYGDHQAGIATPAQDRLVFAAYDVVGDRRELQQVLEAWTDAAVKMTKGDPVAPVEGPPLAPPGDTGEALDLPPSKLTLTFGFGETLFDSRFGLASRRPALLTPIGALPGDALNPLESGGDLCVQACANDPQVAFHAVRNLLRIGRGVVELRWLQLGFGRTSTTDSSQSTPRNLQGFKDGTNNLKGDDHDAMNEHVWVNGDPQSWMNGGTYLVSRRIRMFIETWDRSSLQDQEQTIGRAKESGAPLGKTHEHDNVDLSSTLISADAHIRLASPKTNGGEAILRRGYSYTDGVDYRTGELDAGLFFICFQRNPHTQFAAIQRRLGANDALTEYIQHTSSGLFAVPRGLAQGESVGSGLFS